MIVRLATESDIPALTRLLAQLFEQEAEFHIDPERQRRGLQSIFQHSSGEVLLALEGEQVIAMVSLLYNFSTALGGRVAMLEDMVVSKAYRGQGIGSALLKAAIEQAKFRQCGRVTLLTDHDNHPAQHVYQQQGFIRSSMQAFRLPL
ncbi:GNAT family N-acetyltransferase [Aliagarivorans taiwanensis]|uniref:GNAT family N-acetyltransferase n=1 Tax=Aliagarivorans taiwanensis TaxID=561966 RepID=UPI0004170D7F|nr:GNAT family N-acetyltransferase [Aliagarivorans taiwanensis]